MSKATPSIPQVPDALASATAAFRLTGSYCGGQPYGSGHINDTFLVQFEQGGARTAFIVQRVNRRIFRDIPRLMDNIGRVTAHAAGRAPDPARTLTLVPTRSGASFHVDAEGDYWRCYRFIDRARTYDLLEHAGQAYEAAHAFGRFQADLADLPGSRLHETIPDFHNCRKRLAALVRAIDDNPCGRLEDAKAEADFALSRAAVAEVLPPLVARGELPERITHNDTKLNNVMLDDATGKGVCVIDLDTVMPGLALYDFGDLVRSGTNSSREDHPQVSEVTMRLPIYEKLVAGYAAATGSFLTSAEKGHLAFAGKLITYEMGVRFLTDFLEGDRYFKVARPGHNLDRCRNQFALVRSIEAQEAEMQRIADRILRGPR